MSQMIGEIKLFPYDDIPRGFIKCEGQFLEIKKYPKLYMMIGVKFGEPKELKFKLPDLRKESPCNLTYCISTEGDLPEMNNVHLTPKNTKNY